MNREQIVNGHHYTIMAASPFEVGLLCDGKGVRTWYANSFSASQEGSVEFPDISHPEIQTAIGNHEDFLNFKFTPKEVNNTNG
jgi:hypothetical protein